MANQHRHQEYWDEAWAIKQLVSGTWGGDFMLQGARCIFLLSRQGVNMSLIKFYEVYLGIIYCTFPPYLLLGAFYLVLELFGRMDLG